MFCWLQKKAATAAPVSSDLSAGYFCSGVAGRLRGKVIRVCVNNYGFSDDLVHREPICQEYGKGHAVIGEQRRKIACVVGMETIFGIVVGQCVPESIL